jgi:SAM-dependent methyltransferase
MTNQEMELAAEQLGREAGVIDGLHGYFRLHHRRLYAVAELFGLWSRPQLGDVLEIGPFYGYTPFLLRDRTTSYTVLEGDDPAVYPLKPVYERHHIALELIDLFDTFGPIRGAPHALAFPDARFDTILCWETMEHFNFNPVKFVRELYRIMKPGGTAYITVPNRASFQNLATLLTGRGEKHLIEGYFTHEDYDANGKKCFYGFHWREYTLPEITTLFQGVGFEIAQSGTLYVNQSAPVGFARSAVRAGLRLLGPLAPRFGATSYLSASKPG